MCVCVCVCACVRAYVHVGLTYSKRQIGKSETWRGSQRGVLSEESITDGGAGAPLDKLHIHSESPLSQLISHPVRRRKKEERRPPITDKCWEIF